MAFTAVGSFALALLIVSFLFTGHVGALTCYDCQKLDSDADFYTCLQNPTSVTTVTCTGDEDTCQATLVNNGWLHVVKRACATASVCAEAKNDTITGLRAANYNYNYNPSANHYTQDNDDTTDYYDYKHIS
ncbi:Hypp8630 [Branchiostoma lanceolatum]|uniref:Hypp8630 protein n=1 Tax=Branchiostoma lanceolatum TaxID=7740 RepID=A0A8K0EHY6_BRALA|nr:Hypp8630 [Branchiostoma lanceolatum]